MTTILMNLLLQLDSLYKHCRQGSYKTRQRYYEAMKRFCVFLAEEYRVERLANIAPKHIFSYVLKMQKEGKSASTIKTDLAAIRFFHDQMPHPRYKLPPNDELFLDRRSFGKIDRTWDNTEFNRILGKALGEGRYDYITALYLARYAGLRIHECYRIDTATAEKALREHAITVKGKGGKVRTVPINEQIEIALSKLLKDTQRGHKLLVPDDVATDYAIHQMQAFIRLHRDEVSRPNREKPLTFHGLRHTFAAETYLRLINEGVSAEDAHYKVSHLLGHNRAEVTNIYLASTKGGEAY